MALWWLALRSHGAYDVHILGHGAAEYRLVTTASLQVFALVAMLAFALQVQIARGYILLALPAGVVGPWAARRVWRTWLGRRRVAGDLSHDVLVVGDLATVRHLVDSFAPCGCSSSRRRGASPVPSSCGGGAHPLRRAPDGYPDNPVPGRPGCS